MDEFERILGAIQRGEPQAAGQLLPLVYDELRKLAARKLAHEAPGHTLQATALVHEAYLRLVGSDDRPQWDGRGHFFAAAGEAMRRILVENARRKTRHKHGGDRQRIELDDVPLDSPERPERIIAVDEALEKLVQEDPLVGEIVKLHFFVGMSLEDVARVLGMSRATAYRQWGYARAWLKSEIELAGE